MNLLRRLDSLGAVERFRLWVNRPSKDFAWNRVRSILVIKLDAIGDFVLATPFLRELRRNARDARIVLVVNATVANLAETCPYVDRVLARGEGIPRLRDKSPWRQWRALPWAWRRLRPGRFDVAVIPRWDADLYFASQLAVFAGARAIVGYGEHATPLRGAFDSGYDRLLTHVVSPAGRRGHEVALNLHLIREFGGAVQSDKLELWPTEADGDFASRELPLSRRYVAFAGGAGEGIRCWPAERFREVAVLLQRCFGMTPLSLGAGNDPVMPGGRDFCGKTSLRQTAALLKRCALFVGNDTGLKHIAATMDVPVVEISALRAGIDPNHHHSPFRFHAHGVPYRILRPGAGPSDHAIHEVAVDEVLAACADLLAAAPSGTN